MGKLTEGIVSDGAANPIELRAWCDEQNRKRLFERMSRWYYVADTDGGQAINSIEGGDADNVRKMLAGKLDDFMGWSDARMNGYRRSLGPLAERGMIEAPRVVRQLEPA